MLHFLVFFKLHTARTPYFEFERIFITKFKPKYFTIFLMNGQNYFHSVFGFSPPIARNNKIFQ